jgi:hypothetical protein
VRAAAVEDLPRRRARTDRLGAEVREAVVTRVDDDDRRRGAGRARENEDYCDDRRRPGRPPRGGMRCRIQTYVRSAPGTNRHAAAAMKTFAADESRSTASPATMHRPASTHRVAPIVPTRIDRRLDAAQATMR